MLGVPSRINTNGRNDSTHDGTSQNFWYGVSKRFGVGSVSEDDFRINAVVKEADVGQVQAAKDDGCGECKFTVG